MLRNYGLKNLYNVAMTFDRKVLGKRDLSQSIVKFNKNLYQIHYLYINERNHR